MVSDVGQLRVVAFWYALLGALCSLGTIHFFHLFSLFRQAQANLATLQATHPHTFYSVFIPIADPRTPLLICISAATAFWVSSVLSLRYFGLSSAGQLAALVVSILL